MGFEMIKSVTFSYAVFSKRKLLKRQ